MRRFRNAMQQLRVRRETRRLWLPTAGLMLAASPAGAGAQERLESLTACTAIAAPDQRLACFDRESAALLAAAESGTIRIVERQEIERTQRSLFGFALPKSELLGTEVEVPDTLQTTISGVRRLASDSWAIQIAEGSVWRITNAPSRFRAPEVGEAVVLKKAALGSYFVRVGGQIGVKGRRVE